LALEMDARNGSGVDGIYGAKPEREVEGAGVGGTQRVELVNVAHTGPELDVTDAKMGAEGTKESGRVVG
jgi:hypothetical protein